MGRFRRVWHAVLTLVVTGTLAVVAVPSGAGAAAVRAGGERAGTGLARPELQQALDAIVAGGGASATLAEVRDERGRWRGSAGTSVLGTTRPVRTDGRFRIGSITKSFVSTVLLQLVAERRLTLEDPLARWLPGLVPGGERITIRQLLNHTAGIFNYTEDAEAFPPDTAALLRVRFRTYTPYELVHIATRHEPYFPPGAGWHYSNTDYILAGLVIERLTGHSYGQEVRRRILRPLRLRDTFLPGGWPFIPGPHAHGYLPLVAEDGVRWVDITALNPSVAGAAGEIISTTADVNRFYTALFAGRLLPPALLDAMRTTVPADEGFHYGLGVYSLDLPCGVSVWGHDGGIPGYLTVSLHSADNRRHVTVSVNPLTDAFGAGLQQLVLTEFCGAAAADAGTRQAMPALVWPPGWRSRL